MSAAGRWAFGTWIAARLLAALPVRALAWLFLLTGFAGTRVARLFAWTADRIEGLR